MAAVTKEFIINSLIQYPKSDYEVGFNSSLIMILKKLVEGVDAQKDTNAYNVPTSEIAAFRDIVTKYGNAYRLATDHEIAEIIDAIKSGANLNAVKLAKAAFGVDLKEAKDLVERYIDPNPF